VDPVICSFPMNVPPRLEQLAFTIYEQQGATDEAKAKKRILKSQSKDLKYISSSVAADSKQKNQASDYYIGVFEQGKNKCYLLPAGAAYQMQ